MFRFSDPLYNHANTEKGKYIFNIQLKFCPYTQNNVIPYIDGSTEVKRENMVTSFRKHLKLKHPLWNSKFSKNELKLCVCVCVCVSSCTQPTVGNIYKRRSLWLSCPPSMHSNVFALWFLVAFGIKNNWAEQRFVFLSNLRKDNEKNTVWKRQSTRCTYVCVLVH